SSSVQTGTVGLTELLTPRISNEVRANYSNHRVSTRFGLDNFGAAVPLPDSLLFPPGTSSASGLFVLYIRGVGAYDQGKVALAEQRQVNFVDNLSATAVGHQMKFGVDYRWLAPFSSPYSYRQYAQFLGVTAAPGGALSGTAALAQTNAYQANALLSHNFSV